MRRSVVRLVLAAFGLSAIVSVVHSSSSPSPSPSPGGGDWPYRVVVRPAPPAVKNNVWVRSPIDAFVLAKLEAARLEPAPPATPLSLVRRLYFDLIGLPPTPEQVAEFLADSSDAGYERLIDKLLASPHYGERWGRHWLDVVRFAETNGYERDGPKANAWRYRDYVIQAFNNDKPFDRFIVEQLAGDELDEVTNETRIALGFNRLGPWDDEPADPLMYRFELLDDLVKATSSVFLGMTIQCARCHEHKFDPIPQADYYRLLAFFTPSKHADDLPLATAEERAAFDAENATVDGQVKLVQTQIDELVEPAKKKLDEEKRAKLSPELIAAFDTPAESRTAEQKAMVDNNAKVLELKPDAINNALAEPEREQKKELDQKIKTLNGGRPKPLPVAMGIRDAGGSPPPTHLLKRGDARTPGDAIEPGFVSTLCSETPQIQSPRPDTTGRRLALARWVASPANPMTARVLVNRVWQYHFGTGLVGTASDFGKMGEPPSHPELLDWLAAEFMEPGESRESRVECQKAAGQDDSPLTTHHSLLPWTIKRLHKLILMSNTYRQSSAWNDAASARDPDNRLLWRFNFRRLEAEPIRDAILSVTGRLNAAIGGPSVFPKIDPGILAGQSRPGQGWGKSDERESSRRSVYIFVKRSVRVPLMEVLDAADSNEPCPRRNTSTVAPQALTMLNSEFMNEQARHFADRLIADCGPDPAQQIDRAFRLALARPPRPDELAAGQQFLRDRDSLAAFCLVVLNLSEFVYVD